MKHIIRNTAAKVAQFLEIDKQNALKLRPELYKMTKTAPEVPERFFCELTSASMSLRRGRMILFIQLPVAEVEGYEVIGLYG